jgi:hypothetical protein
MFNCFGTHRSVLCKDKQGIANMVLNQQVTEKEATSFTDKIKDILDGWLPYVTNYCELKDKGWHTEYNKDNKYVTEEMSDDEEPYTKQYHLAWSKCPKKEEIIKLIKDTKYLDTEPALQVFKEITGIGSDTGKKQELLTKAEELIEKAEELKNQAEKL